MLKAVVYATLVALLTVVSVDKVCCVDGCTDSTAASDIAASPDAGRPSDGDHVHTCVLCVMGIEAAPAQRPLSPLTIVGELRPPTMPRPQAAPLALLDHPPRSRSL